jgi:serine phosphatase RsbU (regulator of sigma subunit)/uncharacterized protein HemY
MEAMKKIITLCCAILFFSQCHQSERKQLHSLKFNIQTDSLLNDTTSVSVTIDSLKREVLNATSDTLVINYLNELAPYIRKMTYVIAKEALEQSKKIKYEYGEAEALTKIGSYFRKIADYKKADSLFMIALELPIAKKREDLRAKILVLIGDLRLAQAHYQESYQFVKEALETAKRIRKKQIEAVCLYTMGEVFRMQYSNDTARIYYKEAIAISKEINDKAKIARCLSSMGDMYYIDSDLDNGLKCLQEAMEISKSIKDKDRVLFCASVMGSLYISKGDFKSSLDNLNLAYNIATELKDKLKMGEVSRNLAFLYRTQFESKKAIEYLSRGIAFFEEIGARRNIASAYHMLGEIYHDEKDTVKSMQCYVKSRDLSIELNNKKQLENVLSSIGSLYYDRKNYKLAEDCFVESLRMSEEIGDLANMSYCLKCMTDLYLSQGNFSKSKGFAERTASVAKESEIIFEMMDAQNVLYRVYDTLNMPAKALIAFKEYTKLKDSTTNENQIKKFAAAEYAGKEERLKAEQSAKEKVLNAEKQMKEEEIKRQKTTRNFFIVGFVLLGALAFVIYRSLQQNRKDKAIIQEQKKIVEEKQKEMTDSITYAKRLQEAILPSAELIRNYLPHSFILYKPKDIVAGDFYWFYPLSNNEVLLAVADCTGHGVPGAMVSVVCSNALDRAVKEFGITSTGKILDKVRELVIETFEKSDKNVKDGMDISLVKITNTQNGSLIEWSGANNPLWYISKGVMNKIVADKQPIGKFETAHPFTSHNLSLEKGDVLYLFSDGFADQFGGDKGKKLKYRPLEEYIMTVHEKPLIEQEEELSGKFENWKGNYEQVDDVCIVGIRL